MSALCATCSCFSGLPAIEKPVRAVENALEYRLGVAIGLPIAGWARFSAGDSIGHVDETIGRLAVEWCLSWRPKHVRPRTRAICRPAQA